MKLISDFKNFMSDTVNLNDTRINLLENSVEALKTFIRESDWKPSISRFEEQGSWAHDTIIKPVDGGEFDADLLVMVKPVEGWTASAYVRELGAIFKASDLYADKTFVDDFCVTITYAGLRKIDIAPCVIGREYQGAMEVCDRKNDQFKESNPTEFTNWLRQRTGYSGSNSFRKATRLLKYIRDIKKRFTFPSVLLTTLIGYQI